MVIHPIKTEDDYNNALLRIDALMDAVPGTAEGDELDILATLVEAYERGHFPFESPDPVEAILFRMEQMGIDRKALEPFLGGRNRVSEVLNRKRNLSMSQIRKLHDGLNIPLENLVGVIFPPRQKSAYGVAIIADGAAEREGELGTGS